MPYVFATDVTAPAAVEELVEGVLPARAMSVIYGESGSGKTSLVLDMACRIALEWPWLGRRTRKSVVAYVAAEAGLMILNRVLAFKWHHHVATLPLAIVTCPVDLLDPHADTARLIAMLKEIAATHSEPVSLVVVDTLSRAMAGGNENAPDDMGAMVLNSDRIRHATGAHMLWVHHSGKDSARGARGHSLLRAATDTEIEVSAKDGTNRAVITKQRDSVGGLEFAFALRQVSIGLNQWGTDMTACVVDPLELPVTRALRARTPPRGAMIALRALREAIENHGKPLPITSIPPGVHAVTGKVWRARYNTLVPLDLDNESPRAIQRAEETRRKQFTRSRTALQEEFVDGCNDYWWLK